MVVVTVGNAHHRIAHITVFLSLPKQFHGFYPGTTAPLHQFVIRYRVPTLLKRKGIEAERSTRCNHEAIGSGDKIIVILGGRYRVDIRYASVICRNTCMIEIHGIIVIGVTKNIEIRCFPATQINTIVQFLLHISFVHCHKIHKSTSLGCIGFRA